MKYRYKTIASLLALTLMLGGSALAADAPIATAPETSTTAEAVTAQPNNLSTTGAIAEAGKTDYGYQILIDDTLIVNLPAEGCAPIYDVRDGSVSTLTADQLEKGMHIAVLYGANTPMALSLPPQISQIKALVVMPEIMTTVVDTFDRMESGAYINPTATLVLHVSDETPIYDMNGAKVTAEEFAADNAAEKDSQSEYAVFYSVATFSLPPQTSPVLMLELDTPVDSYVEATSLNEDSSEETAAEPTDSSESTETTPLEMQPLRAAAEAAGYTVEWNGDTQVILMHQGAVSYTLTIGQQQAGYNKSLIQLDAAPELRDGVTYVPSTFLQMITQVLEG